MNHLKQSDQTTMERLAGMEIGDRAVCSECGRFLIYTDTGWQHAGINQPRHIAIPAAMPQGSVWVGDAPEEPQPGLAPALRTLKAIIHIGEPPYIRLEANTSPRQAADMLRETYTAEWIAKLLMCLQGNANA